MLILRGLRRARPARASQLVQSNASYRPRHSRPLHTGEFAVTAPKVTLRATSGDDVRFAWTRGGLFLADAPGTEARRTGLGGSYTAQQLRDSCSCPSCRDVSSGQKSFSTTQVRDDMGVVDVAALPGGGLRVTVDVDMDSHGGAGGHDIHLSPWWVLTQAELVRRPGLSLQERLPRRFRPTYWDAAGLAGQIRRVDYGAFMDRNGSDAKQGSAAFWDVVADLMRLGIVVLTGVPRDEGSVARIASRIANVRETFYGHTFDVRAKPNAENVAYTSGYLGLHQDLMYLDPPPFIQILHCMDNSCAGGESLFSDADRVGRTLAALGRTGDHAEAVAPLSDFPVPYGYRRDGNWYHRRRPLLNVNPVDGSYDRVYWSPPFQAEMTEPVTATTVAASPDGPSLLPAWIRAARIFEDAVNDPSAMYQTRMGPGDCVLFNNLRVLHGRRAFDAEGGSRWLRGTYIAQEDFLSAALHAPETHAAPVDNPNTWWDPAESDKELLELPLAGELAGRLDAIAARS